MEYQLVIKKKKLDQYVRYGVTIKKQNTNTKHWVECIFVLTMYMFVNALKLIKT